MYIPGSILASLTDEQKKKAEAAQSPEELLSLAREFGYELSPEQLETAAGGSEWTKCSNYKNPCPNHCYDM
jgi:hypothetical protein